MPSQLFAHPYPYAGRDNTQNGITVTGSCQLFGLYPAGGEPINWTNIISGFGFNELNPAGLGKGLANASALVTVLAASAGTITATAANNFAVGQKVKFQNLTTTIGLLLNGQTVTIVTASATAFTFVNAATGTGTSETGIAVSGNGSGVVSVGATNMTAPVTTLAASGGIITATAANNFLPGASVTFQNCTTTLGLLLNGLTFTVLTATATTFTFTSASTGTGTSETGSAYGSNPGQPLSVRFWSSKASGYSYAYAASVGALHVMVGAASASLPDADLATGAYPAGVLSDIVRYEARFIRA